MKRALDIPSVPHNLTVTAIVRRLEISVTYRIKIDYHIKQITKLCFSFQAFLFFFGAVARWDGVEEVVVNSGTHHIGRAVWGNQKEKKQKKSLVLQIVFMKLS